MNSEELAIKALTKAVDFCSATRGSDPIKVIEVAQVFYEFLINNSYKKNSPPEIPWSPEIW